MTQLRAENLGKQYAGEDIVRDFNLKLCKGEILGLLGPNGAGKSTTLNMLSGCLKPDTGLVTIDGQALFADRDLQRKLGYLPERPPLYNSLSINEQLHYAGQLFGQDNIQTSQRLEYVLAECELHEVSDKLIGQLSKGYRQRTGIAQALMHNPEIIILDEPTDGLDPVQIQSLRKLIQRLGKQHAVLLSSHFLTEVEQVCQRALIMHQGRTVFSDSMESLRNSGQSLETIFTEIIYHDVEAAI